MIEVRQATTQAELDDVRGLMRAFVLWHRERNRDDIALVNRYFNTAAFEQELQSLPGAYAAPRGSLLIAYDGEMPAGCVALRDLGDGVCEMKRMFVPDAARGRGAGRRLTQSILADARAIGYSRMRLETSRRQHEAIGLYERSGFVRIPHYNQPAEDARDWLVAYELAL